MLSIVIEVKFYMVIRTSLKHGNITFSHTTRGRYSLMVLANITLSILEHLNKYNFQERFSYRSVKAYMYLTIPKGITIMVRGCLPLVDQSSQCVRAI